MTRRKRIRQALKGAVGRVRGVVSALTPQWVENHLARRKLVHHALKTLEPYQLSEKARRECVVALSELNGKLKREENAKRMLAELPLVFGYKDAKPRQKELVERLKRELELESHEVRVRMWKLILELGKENENEGIRKTAEVIAAFDRSFRIPD